MKLDNERRNALPRVSPKPPTRAGLKLLRLPDPSVRGRADLSSGHLEWGG